MVVITLFQDVSSAFNLLSDSLYTVYVLQHIKTAAISTYNVSLHSLFHHLQSLIHQHSAPFYATHI